MINHSRFDGTMSQAQRANTIEEFGQKTDEPLILLISLKAGGVGLNLTMANCEYKGSQKMIRMRHTERDAQMYF